MKKKCTLVLAIAIICMASFPVFAASQSGFQDGVAPTAETELLSPFRYSYIDEFELSAQKSGTSVSASATVLLPNSAASSKTVLTLERSSGGSYSSAGTIKDSGKVTNKYYTTSGTITASGSYSYRVKAAVYVYNSSGSQIDSDIIYYYL